MSSITNTWEDGQSIAAQAWERQVKSIMVVTSWLHGRRALCVIRQQLAGSAVMIYYVPIPDAYGPENWWCHKKSRQAVLRELIKIDYYWGRTRSFHGIVKLGRGWQEQR